MTDEERAAFAILREDVMFLNLYVSNLRDENKELKARVLAIAEQLSMIPATREH